MSEITPVTAELEADELARKIAGFRRDLFGVGRETHSSSDAVWADPQPLPLRGETGEPDPFPVGLLPSPLADATSEVSRFCKVALVAPALVGLAALGVSIGKRAVVVERRGLSHHPALFFVGIAGSGERKSPVFRAMSAPLEDWAEARIPAYEEEKRQAEANNAVIDAIISGLKQKSKGEGVMAHNAQKIAALKAQRQSIPPFPRLFSSDPTEPKVFQLMHDRGGEFSVLSGEGRPVIDALMGKYSKDSQTGDAIYLAGISGDTITRDRVGSPDRGQPTEEKVIRRPCLNVCIMVQPDKYIEAATHPSLQASGAIGRVWPAWLPVMVGKQHEQPNEPGLSSELMRPYGLLLHRLLDFEPPEDEQGRRRAHVVHLSPKASDARRDFHNEIQNLMADGGDLEDCRKIAAKAVTQTCKLALCLHLAEAPDVLHESTSEIPSHVWARAQALGTWFLTEAVRVQRIADEAPAIDLARRVLRWLERDGRKVVRGSCLQQYGPRPRPTAHQAGEILSLLADHGYLREEIDPGARKPIYHVNPALFSHFSQFSQGKQ